LLKENVDVNFVSESRYSSLAYLTAIEVAIFKENDFAVKKKFQQVNFILKSF
jgi:hypothetical protein